MNATLPLRPELALATEQTVLNLKELEARIHALKADLSYLCQGLGQTEAARIAAAPATAPAAAMHLGFQYAGLSPQASFGFAPPAQAPFANTAFVSPFAAVSPTAAVPGAAPYYGSASFGFSTPSIAFGAPIQATPGFATGVPSATSPFIASPSPWSVSAPGWSPAAIAAYAAQIAAAQAWQQAQNYAQTYAQSYAPSYANPQSGLIYPGAAR